MRPDSPEKEVQAKWTGRAGLQACSHWLDWGLDVKLQCWSYTSLGADPGICPSLGYVLG